MSSLVDSEANGDPGCSGLMRSTAIVCGLLFLCLAVGPDAQGQTRVPQSSQTTAVPGALGGLVMVVPFTNLSQQPGDEWVGWGIAETVTADLVEAGVAVVQQAALADALSLDATRARPALDRSTLLEASRRLAADWLVTGTYQRVGMALRLTARVIDVRTGATRNTVKLDGVLADVFDLQDQIGAVVLERPVPRPAETRRAVVPAGELAFPDAASASPSGGEVSGVLEWRGAAQADSSTERELVREGAGFAASVQRPPTTVIARISEAPRIDGLLGDAVWERATHLTEFVQVAPVEGAPGSEETEVWLAYDSENLYIAFYAHYSNPGMMRTNRADRDEIRGDDRMSVLFDPFFDQQRAYQFEVNGYGVQADSIVNADGRSGARSSRAPRPQQTSGVSRPGGSSGSGLSNSGQFGIRGDDSWNTLFTSAGEVVDDGWTAELAIPFKSLRYPATSESGSRRWGLQITRVIRGKSEAQAWSPISRGVAGQLTQFGIVEGLGDLSQSRNLEFLPEVTGVRLGGLDADSGVYDTQDPEGAIGLGIKYGITPNLTADAAFNPDFSQIEADQPQIETNQRFALFFPEQRPFFLEGQEIFQTPTLLNLFHTRTVIDPRFGGKLTGKVGRTTLGIVAADDEAAGRLDDPTDPRIGTVAQTFVGRARYDVYAESYLGAIATSRAFGDDYNRVAGIDGRFRLGNTHLVSFLAAGSSTRDAENRELSGPVVEADYTRQGRNLGYGASYSSVDPEFRTQTGFLQRLDYRQATGNISYRWWPESALITWGPTLRYLRLYDYAGVLQDEQLQGQASFSFTNNISLNGTLSRDFERFNEIDFRKTGYGFYGVISARLLSVVGGMNWGDGVLFSDTPFLGRSTVGSFLISARPTSRLRAELTGSFSQFVDPSDSTEVFDVKIFRTRATYQFTRRLSLRHILEYNTAALTLGNNLLLTYRINAGTVMFLGYDDRHQQGSRIGDALFMTSALMRTNRAVFAKVSYLFRY